MERKFKIGDKVRVVKINHVDDIKINDCIGKVYEVAAYTMNNTYGLLGNVNIWQEDELDFATGKENIISKITSAIIEAGKNAPIIVERTEDGGIKISPIEEDLPIDTPCMVGNESNELWGLRYYAYGGRVFMNGLKSKDEGKLMKYDYIIPFDKFNPNDIEGSLKHNIVKQ